MTASALRRKRHLLLLAGFAATLLAGCGGNFSVVAKSAAKTTPTISWPTPAAIPAGTALSAVQLDATASVPGTFLYTPAAGTIPGTDTLTLTFTPTDTTNYNSTTASVSLTVSAAAKTTPTISWPTPAAIPAGTALSAAQLNATASVPGTFLYTPAAGTVPATGTDTLTLTFTPTDTTNYNSTTASVSLTVSAAAKTTPTISWPTPAAIPAGTALSAVQLDATASVPGTFTYTPAAGTIPATGTNTLTLTFTPTDTTAYNSTTASVSLTVSAAAKTTPTISWPTPAAIPAGTALSAAQLDATASVPGTFLYTPAAGTIPATGIDTLTLTFTPTDTTNYNSTTASVSLTVSAAAKTTPTISWPTPAAIPAGTALSAAQLDATASVPGTFLYTPAAGTIPATGTDTLTLTFTPTDTTAYNSTTASVSLTVSAAAKTTPTISWPTPAAIPAGTALSAAQLDATASVPGTFLYTPAAGTVPATGTDTLTLTFTPTDTTNYNSTTASVSLTVSAAAKTTPTISWPTPAAIPAGTALSAAQLDATASVPGTFLYTPAAGTVPATGTDTLTLTFTPTDTTNYNSTTASVSLTVSAAAKTTPTISWPTPAAIPAGTALSAAQLDATASVPGTFLYTPAAGTVPATGTDTLTLTFTPTDTTNYNSTTASVSLTVSAAAKTTPTISWPTPAAIPAGTALSAAQLDATASVPGTFLYTPAAGTVPATGTDTLTLTFTPTDTTNYNSTTASVSLTVSAAAKTTPTISWPTPAAIPAGTALSAAQLDATASVPGTFLYTPAAGTVPATGTDTLTLTFTPTDTTNYNSTTASVSLTVSAAAKTTPTISWPTPAAIPAGTALSAAQLDATASVPGTFLYTPAAGTVPATGTDTLTLTFTPTDTTNYNSTTASASLTVQAASTTGPSTIINVASTISQTGLKHLGINLDSQTYYDSGQMMRNLTFANPGFESQIGQTILECVAVTDSSCTDQNPWSTWPANFAQGLQFNFIYGAANGETGTVISSTVANSSTGEGVTINFAGLSTPPAVGDFVVVRGNTPGNSLAGWWPSTSGGATFTTETTDISPDSPGKQALSINASGSGQSANLSSYFDSSAGRSFLQLNGTYTITFRAKSTGGSSSLSVSATRSGPANETFFSQSVPLTSSWQNYSFQFTANETGSSIGTAALSFDISGGSLYLDDVALTEAAAPTNPTVFRNAVVTTLEQLQPGTLRYMDGGTDFGSTISNMLAVPYARQPASFSTNQTAQADIPMGLHEFLQLCQTVGAEPWYNLPPAITPTEIQNLIEYFAGPSTTPYGAIRASLGQAAPWTSVFPVIHLELGNEQWNFGTFPGGAINSPEAYGSVVNTVYGAAMSSPYYTAGSFDLIMGTFAAVPWWTQQEIAYAGSNYNSVAAAPYLFNTLNDTSSNEAIFGPMFAQPESVDSVSSGYMYQQQQVTAAAGKNLNVYEVQLSTLSGTASQSMVNAVVPSISAGITVAEHMLLMMRDLGVKTQQVWSLHEYDNNFTNTAGGSETSPIFGAVIDMGGETNLKRPVFLAEQLANQAILSNMLTTTVSGTNPTWNQPLSTNDNILLSTAHEIQSFAFTDGGSNYSVVVFNLDRTTAQPITFTGNVPTGTVTVSVLTAANLTDTNENSSVVNTSSTTISNFSPSTPHSLPPFSMTVFQWQ